MTAIVQCSVLRSKNIKYYSGCVCVSVLLSGCVYVCLCVSLGVCLGDVSVGVCVAVIVTSLVQSYTAD